MKKDFIPAIISAVCVAGAVTAFCMNNIVIKSNVEFRIDTKHAAEFYASTEDRIYELLNSIYSGDELYDEVETYTLFKARVKPTEEEFDVVYDFISDGMRVSDIAAACRFWETTNDDISVLREICSRNENYDMSKDLYWYEDAYNEITDYVHGVLDEEDVKSYVEKGLTTEDMSIANVLSRKGVYTIKQILKLRLNNRTWIEIFDDVYPYLFNDGIDDYTEITDGRQILHAVYLASWNKTDIYKYLDMLKEEPHIDLLNAALDDSVDLMLAKLNKKGYWDLDTEAKEQNAIHSAELKEILKDSGVSEQAIAELNNNGVSDINILNAIQNGGMEVLDNLKETAAAEMVEKGDIR